MNRYEDEEELEIPSENPHLSTNIRQLRTERRLSIEEFSDQLNVDVETVKAWEKGTLVPTPAQINSMLPILKIGLYDMMTRDILGERNQTTIQMKKSKDRGNYDWFYGSRKKVIISLVYIIITPLIFFVAFLLNKDAGIFNEETLEVEPVLWVRILCSYRPCAIISGIIIAINFFMRIHYRFQIWHIFLIEFLFIAIIIVGLIGAIPYYIYTIVMLIMKRGKNHL